MLGNYVYADGGDNVRVCAAVDALTMRLQAARPGTALAFLAAPTDVLRRPGWTRLPTRPAPTRTAPRRTGWPEGCSTRCSVVAAAVHCAYPPDADPGICDSLITQQGPNYALAKRAQRWRATAAREDGAVVSLNVAPPTANPIGHQEPDLAAAYEGRTGSASRCSQP